MVPRPAVMRAPVVLVAASLGFCVAWLGLQNGFFGTPIEVATLVDGASYKGQIIDGRLQGEGRIDWPGGAHYEGEFDQGQMHGQGVYTDAQGNQFEGEFRRGVFSGSGRIETADGSHYEGQTRDWRMHGEGSYRIDEIEYRGQFVQDEFAGQGEHFESGELLYRGEFEYWYYQGEGELMLAGGDRYQGEFDYGLYHGKGTMYLAQPRDGVSEYSGVWKHGRLVSSEQSAFVESAESDLERALYTEGNRLEKALLNIEAGDPQKPEIFFLGIAGDGTQRVFSREVNAFRQYFDERYALGERQISLVNDHSLIAVAPMATLTSIERAIATLGERMNIEQDLLVVYISSHGSAEHEITLQNESLDLADMKVTKLAALLQSSGIKHRLIFVSACYSGGFIEPLKNDYSLIMTAAALDKTSFGCSDEAEMTYFGRALLDTLPMQEAIDDVYKLLVAEIAKRETAEDLSASEPQFYRGKHFDAGILRDSNPGE